MSVQVLQPSITKKKLFEDPNHTDKVFEGFDTFYKEQKYVDIVLVAAIDNVKVKAHRIVVSASSDYFMAMFSSTLKESTAEEIVLQNIDGSTLHSIIDFIYSGKLELNSDIVQNVLIAADFLQINELIVACCEFMAHYLDVSDCLDTAVFAENLNYPELSQQAYCLAVSRFAELFHEKDYLELNYDQLLKMISHKEDADCIVNEETIFLGIVAWIEHDKVNREAFVFDLLAVVEYQLLTPRFIIENRHSICVAPECYEMILTWLEWHLLPDEAHDSPKAAPNRIAKKKNIIIMIPGEQTTTELKAQMYRSQLNWWSEMEIPSSPVKKANYGVAFINEQIIFVGGKANANGILSSSSSVECLNIGTMEWSELPSMQQSRHQCAVVELNGEMYAIGGYSTHNMLNTVEKYDFSTGEWQYVAPLVHYIRIAEAQVLNGRIYVLDVASRVMQCYNPTTNKWSLTSVKTEASKYYGTAAGCGYLYTVGGFIDNDLTNTVERYDPINDTWSFMAPLEKPRCGIKCVFLNNRIIACAGRENEGFSCRVEEYNPRTNKWTELVPLLSAMDGRSKIMSY
ncbi:kelch-like protein 5 [Eupeodes corollae]|uniref:kelch-like protein 5 n=1 Tax=Eupeodes corollae TaxID=290404 RepID=UPI002490BBA0|nr:kelch-like protein 5 [Eupeodes corollae]